MEIVLASVKDAKALSYLKREIWNTTYREIYDDNDIYNYDFKSKEEKFRNLVLDKNQEVYVCKDNNKIIGYMVIGSPLHESLEGYELAINDLGIDKEYRGQGIGRKFIEVAKSKKKKLFNCCNYYNENARKFYEKMGGILVKTHMDSNSKRNSQVYYIY